MTHAVLNLDFITVWNPETSRTEVNIFAGNNSEPILVIPLRDIVTAGIAQDLDYQASEFSQHKPWMHETDIAENRLVSKELRQLSFEYDVLVDNYTSDSGFETEEEMLQELVRESEEMGLYEDPYLYYDPSLNYNGGL
jgi:hypothetical protein